MDFKPLEHNTKHEFDSISNLKQHPEMDYPSQVGKVMGMTRVVLGPFLVTWFDAQTIAGNAIPTNQTTARKNITYEKFVFW